MDKQPQPQPQSQASVTDQLQELLKLGNKAGLYDAVDWVQYALKNSK